jgi:hypothetical protein
VKEMTFVPMNVYKNRLAQAQAALAYGPNQRRPRGASRCAAGSRTSLQNQVGLACQSEDMKPACGRNGRPPQP